MAPVYGPGWTGAQADPAGPSGGALPELANPEPDPHGEARLRTRFRTAHVPVAGREVRGEQALRLRLRGRVSVPEVQRDSRGRARYGVGWQGRGSQGHERDSQDLVVLGPRVGPAPARPGPVRTLPQAEHQLRVPLGQVVRVRGGEGRYGAAREGA